jgi:hypothetical protein
LMGNLIENVHVPDVGGERALSGKVSSSPTAETGTGEHTHPGPVNIHGDNG